MRVRIPIVGRQLSRPFGIGLVALMLVGPAVPAFAQTANAVSASTTSAPPATAQAQPLTVRDWVKRPEMLGDWGGTRTTLAEHGFTVGASWTQFFQWAPTVDDERAWEYGGKLDFNMNQDLTKQGWSGVTATSHVEFRYGDVPLLAGGTLTPTSSALLFPKAEGASARVSSLYLSKAFSDTVTLQAGRFNTVDRDQGPFAGGQGLDRFSNLAFVAPPLFARTMPPVAEGVFFKTSRKSERFVTLGLFESTDESFFKNGATFLASVSVPHQLFATPGHIAGTLMASSIDATSLDNSPYVLLPSSGKTPELKSNAFTFDLTFDQYLWWDPAEKKGFGLFGMFGFSEANPSPLDAFGHLGVGGNSPIPGRSDDTFGAGYFFTGVSNALKFSFDPLLRLRNEQGFEGYYNVAVTNWSKVTADFQFIDPFAIGSKTRGFFSVRWKLVF